MSSSSPWPALPLSEWSETCETLLRWTQVVGKVRMVLTPLVNHWRPSNVRSSVGCPCGARNHSSDRAAGLLRYKV